MKYYLFLKLFRFISLKIFWWYNENIYIYIKIYWIKVFKINVLVFLILGSGDGYGFMVW